VGAKNAPAYRIVVTDSRSPRDGRFIEEIGSYDPKKAGVNYILDLERAATGWVWELSRRRRWPASSRTRDQGGRVRPEGRFERPRPRSCRRFSRPSSAGWCSTPDVRITPRGAKGETVYEVRVHPADVGRLVGRRGNTINAIRTLLTAGGARKGVRCSLELLDERAWMPAGTAVRAPGVPGPKFRARQSSWATRAGRGHAHENRRAHVVSRHVYRAVGREHGAAGAEEGFAGLAGAQPAGLDPRPASDGGRPAVRGWSRDGV
jgi:predicted RNA-binding protein YlqC (UPF0109 family)